MGGKALGAGAELAVDGGPEILEGGEKVNPKSIKNLDRVERYLMRRKRIFLGASSS